MASGVALAMNSVAFLLDNPFERLNLQDKLAIKNLGPDTPDIKIVQPTKDRGKTYHRTFSRAWYEKKRWLSGCSQRKQIDMVQAQRITENFVSSMSRVRDSIPSICAQYIADTPRRGGGPNLERIGYEVCDTVIANARDRFAFTGHLAAAVLLDSQRFPDYAVNFPSEALLKAIDAYPMLHKARLQTELGLIYENPDFRPCSSAMALFQLFCKNSLTDVFSETLKLIRIVITTPMTTAESERCFSTLKRIKTFLRNTMAQDRLNALAMLSIEKNLTRDIPEFNRLVIEKFAHMKDRRAKFLYK